MIRLMRVTPAAAAVLLALAAPVARADSALYLSWNDCALGSESVQTFLFDCGTEAGFEELARRCAGLAGRFAAVLEGGYNLETLPRLVHAALLGFDA